MQTRRSLFLLSFLLFLPVTATDAQDGFCTTESCPTVTSDFVGIPVDEMVIFPAASVMKLAVDSELLGDRMYQRITGPAPVLSAPDGDVVREMPPGFTFVTTQGFDNDYTQLNPGEWILSSYLTPVWPSEFSGVLFDQSLNFPLAWVLRNVVPSTRPGLEPPESGLPIIRYERVSLFSYVLVDGWRWYQVGPDQWIHQTNVATVTPVERPTDVDTERWVSVDLYEQVLIAYEGNTPVFATLTSSGLEDWPTNEGLFHVYYRNPRAPMSGANAQPDFYDLEEVPWTMYFDGDIALHGAYWHDGFGYRRSHGCVNLSVTDAHWLYSWASPEFDTSVPNDTGLAVYVYSSGVYR